MANLTKLIQERMPVQAMDAWLEATNVPRARLGLSQCGHKCKRYLWYCHQGYTGKTPEGRVLRLFELGNILEEQTIEELKAVGYNHHSCQKEVVLSLDGLTLKGHIDGSIEGLPESSQPHLFEHKTASDKRFNQLVKCGNYREWSEGYWWQLQFYCLGLNLKRAAVFVYNKNTSEIYFERVKFEKQATLERIADVFAAITSEQPPERACPRRDWYEAKFCNLSPVCWENE